MFIYIYLILKINQIVLMLKYVYKLLINHVFTFIKRIIYMNNMFH